MLLERGDAMIYETISALCEEKGISINELEKDLHFGQGSIGKMRTNNPRIDRLQQVADYFGVSLDFLMTGKDIEKKSEEGTSYYFNDETAQIAQKLFEDKDMRLLFDAARDSKPENLQMAAEMLKRFKETNPNG